MPQPRLFQRPEALLQAGAEPGAVPKNTPGEVLWHWWRGLDNARGDRAQLRRCSDPTHVVFVPAFAALMRDLQSLRDFYPERIAPVAGLLAQLRRDKPGEFPKQMATNPSGDKPIVSTLRFQRLLQASNAEQLFPRLRRVLPLMNNEADLFSLADAIYFWGDRVRKQWAYDYFAALPPSYQP